MDYLKSAASAATAPYKSQLTLFENRKGITGSLGAGVVFVGQWIFGFVMIMIIMLIWWWDTEGKWKYALGIGAGWALGWAIVSYYILYSQADRILETGANVVVPGSGTAFKLAATASDAGMGQMALGVMGDLEQPTRPPGRTTKRKI